MLIYAFPKQLRQLLMPDIPQILYDNSLRIAHQITLASEHVIFLILVWVNREAITEHELSLSKCF